MSSEKHPVELSSMDYWYPKLKDSGIPMPETKRQKIRDWDDATEIYEGAPVSLIDFNEINSFIEEIGPEVFIRTDQSSAKHNMNKAGKIDGRNAGDIQEYFTELLLKNEMQGIGGLPYKSVYVREWLNLNSCFTAFRGTPISSEIRVFVYDGDIYDKGFYWPEESIKEGHHTSELPENWEDELKSLKEHSLNAFDEVKPVAEQIAEKFDGYWSVDFAETEEGEWYLIDMAKGDLSWHPEKITKPEEFQ